MFKFLAILVFLFGLFLAGCDCDSKTRSNNQSNVKNYNGRIVSFKDVSTQEDKYYNGNSYNISDALVIEKGYLNQGLAYVVVVCTDSSIKKWCIVVVDTNSINNLLRGDLVNFNGKYYGYMNIVVKDKNNKDITLKPQAFLVNGVSYIKHSIICGKSGNETKRLRDGSDDEYYSTIFTPNFLDITDWNNPFSPAFSINPMNSISPYSGGGSLNGFDDDF